MRVKFIMLFVSAVLVAAGHVVIVQAADEAAQPAPAAAQPAPAAAMQGPCHADVQKFCKDVQPGGGRIYTCLDAHQTELSEACQTMHRWAKDRIAKLHQACDADVQKFCKDVEQGGGRLIMCLKAKGAELSPACQAEFKVDRPATAEAEK